MQNLQNMFGIPNVQQHFNHQREAQIAQAQMAAAQMAAAAAPRQAAAPAAKCLADAPICNPNATSKELYAVENALKKDYDPIKREWVEENIKIQIERKPFAEGAMRAAYRMKIIEGMDVHGADRYYVLKLSKDPHEPTRQYYKDVETQMESRKWATEYNKRGVPKQVDFIPAYVVILVDRPMKPTCTMERHVEGEYVKYNDNWSWCDEKRNTPQAFSHFTWEASGNKLLICDLQGVGDCWTDPQIHTIDGKGYGKGNAGVQGVRQFMKQHKCNSICRALKLQSVTGRVKQADVGTQWGAAIKKRSNAIAEQKKQGITIPDQMNAQPEQVGVGLSLDGGLASGVMLPIIVICVKSNSPAAKSGQVQRGDFVIQVDDVPVQGATVSAVKKLIQGAPGSHVTVHLMRGIKTYSVTLTREAAPQTVVVPNKRKAHDRVIEVMAGKGHADSEVSAIIRDRPDKIHRLPTPPKGDESAKENTGNIAHDPAANMQKHANGGLFGMNGLFGMPNHAPPLMRAGSGAQDKLAGFFV